MGYVQGIQSIPGQISKLVNNAAGSVPNLSGNVTAKFGNYVQQNVSPSLDSYLAIGILMAVVGSILIVFGERRTKTAKEEVPLKAQIPMKQQE